MNKAVEDFMSGINIPSLVEEHLPDGFSFCELSEPDDPKDVEPFARYFCVRKRHGGRVYVEPFSINKSKATPERFIWYLRFAVTNITSRIPKQKP